MFLAQYQLVSRPRRVSRAAECMAAQSYLSTSFSNARSLSVAAAPDGGTMARAHVNSCATVPSAGVDQERTRSCVVKSVMSGSSPSSSSAVPAAASPQPDCAANPVHPVSPAVPPCLLSSLSPDAPCALHRPVSDGAADGESGQPQSSTGGRTDRPHPLLSSLWTPSCSHCSASEAAADVSRAAAAGRSSSAAVACCQLRLNSSAMVCRHASSSVMPVLRGVAGSPLAGSTLSRRTSLRRSSPCSATRQSIVREAVRRDATTASGGGGGRR